MITLTGGYPIRTVLGGTATVNYDKLVVVPKIDPVNESIVGSILISSSAEPDMPVIQGTLTISAKRADLEIRIEYLDFYRKITLTTPQNDAVKAIIADAQDAIEDGLISLGVVDGVQSSGV